MDGFRNAWFDHYSWVIRVNPDVLIYNEKIITQYMTSTSNINGIFGSCACRYNATHHTYCRDAIPLLPDFPPRKNWNHIIMTDFMAFRPAAVDRALVHESTLLLQGNAEFRATKMFRSLVDSNTTVWVKGKGDCRGARRWRRRW